MDAGPGGTGCFLACRVSALKYLTLPEAGTSVPARQLYFRAS